MIIVSVIPPTVCPAIVFGVRSINPDVVFSIIRKVSRVPRNVAKPHHDTTKIIPVIIVIPIRGVIDIGVFVIIDHSTGGEVVNTVSVQVTYSQMYAQTFSIGGRVSFYVDISVCVFKGTRPVCSSKEDINPTRITAGCGRTHGYVFYSIIVEVPGCDLTAKDRACTVNCYIGLVGIQHLVYVEHAEIDDNLSVGPPRPCAITGDAYNYIVYSIPVDISRFHTRSHVLPSRARVQEGLIRVINTQVHVSRETIIPHRGGPHTPCFGPFALTLGEYRKVAHWQGQSEGDKSHQSREKNSIFFFHKIPPQGWILFNLWIYRGISLVALYKHIQKTFS